MRTAFTILAPLTVAFGLLAAVTDLIVARRRARRPRRAPAPAPAAPDPPSSPEDQLASLARERGWTLAPVTGETPESTKRLTGSKLGTISGQVRRRSFVVTRYTGGTEFKIGLPVSGLPAVQITLDPASGEVDYRFEEKFGERLMSPGLAVVMKLRGVLTFVVMDDHISCADLRVMSARQLSRRVDALVAVADMLPGVVLRAWSTTQARM
jgi:hypothetical protein